MTGNVYNCDDQELGNLLHQLLIVEGQPEVEIIHPEEGQIIFTREGYLKLLDQLERVKNLSPANRMSEAARLQRKRQMQFRTAMIDARVEKVNLEDDENFGKNIEGKDIGINGMVFVPIQGYLKGVQILEGEVGCFMDENMARAPVRIVGA